MGKWHPLGGIPNHCLFFSPSPHTVLPFALAATLCGGLWCAAFATQRRMKKGNNTESRGVGRREGGKWSRGWRGGVKTYAALLAFHRESFRAVNDARQRIEKSELTKLYTIFCLFNFDGCGSQKSQRGGRGRHWGKGKEGNMAAAVENPFCPAPT